MSIRKKDRRVLAPYLVEGEEPIASLLLGGPTDRVSSNLGADSAIVFLTDRALRVMEDSMRGPTGRQLAVWPIETLTAAGPAGDTGREWGKVGGRGKEYLIRFEFSDGQALQGRTVQKPTTRPVRSFFEAAHQASARRR